MTHLLLSLVVLWPYAKGTTPPAFCELGEQFLDTDADTNGSLLICIFANTWKDVDDDGGGGSLTCEEADASPSVANVTKLQFDQADGFVVTDETGGQAQIDLAAIPDSVLASSYSGVGVCGANTWASTLSDNAAPTCTQPAFSNLSGAATDAQVPNNITIDLATTATTANAGDSATSFFSSGTIEVARGGTGAAPGADDQVLVSDSTSGATWRSVPNCGESGTLNYDSSTNLFSCLTDSGGGGGGLVTNILAANVACAVSTSYCTIWSHTPATASRGVFIRAFIIIDSNSATVAPQFRVSSADTGYTGICTWQLHAAAAATTTAPVYDNIAIGATPADTADTAWIDAPKIAQVYCALLADASPGPILIEWQLETGTSPTQNVLAGSYMTASN